MNKLLSMVAILALSSVGAMAAGTTSGGTISNSASLSYSVGGATQPTVNTAEAATFVVDKKIDFSVSHDDDPKHVITTPGAITVERTFTLSNTTNNTQDFTVDATNLASGKLYDGKTDDSDITDIKISVDGGAFVSGPVTIAGLIADGTKEIKVQVTVPNTNVDGNVMNIQLEATAVKAGTTDPEVVTGAGADGTISADRKDVEDTVLAEGAGVGTTGNTEFDGKYSAWAGYIINSPVLDLTKSSCVYEDLVSGVSANAKRIPGSTITYLFDINNTGSIDAEDINITDVLPAELDGATVTALMMNDNQDSCSCVGGTAGAGSATTNAGSGQTVKINSLTAKTGKHNCVTLQVKIK